MKLCKSQENPIDILNIEISEWLCPVFKSFGLTANDITTLSLLFGVIALRFLWNYNWVAFAVTYYISYLFDCMDGHYARKYKLVSKFGDYYDHVKDISVIIGLVIVVIMRYKVPKPVFYKFFVVMSVYTVLMVSHLGCQERIYPHADSPTLEFTKRFCPGDPTKTIQISKWFGCATWTILLISAMYYLNENRNENRV